ncbi:DUF928 domain-containing protein [Lusitaniella coriacea]|uniref:DUF928 domain-containing protein n=1 Tax=Lusitaniella coriacea TaxID=1983105 RepID=UPI003CFB348E
MLGGKPFADFPRVQLREKFPAIDKFGTGSFDFLKPSRNPSTYQTSGFLQCSVRTFLLLNPQSRTSIQPCQVVPYDLVMLHFFKRAIANPIQYAVISSTLAFLSLTPAVFAQSIPERWGEANQYQPPPGIGQPIRRESGGTRSPMPVRINPNAQNRQNESESVLSRLTALVPVKNEGFGVTIRENPTLWVYVASIENLESQIVAFTLLDEEGRIVYRANLEKIETPGLVSISLPEDLALELDKDYYWFCRIVDSSLIELDHAIAEGWIRRVKPPATLENIASLPPEQQALHYAEAEVWYDALTLLAQRYQENPRDRSIEIEWIKLLEAAGLGEISQFKFANRLPNSE